MDADGFLTPLQKDPIPPDADHKRSLSCSRQREEGDCACCDFSSKLNIAEDRWCLAVSSPGQRFRAERVLPRLKTAATQSQPQEGLPCHIYQPYHGCASDPQPEAIFMFLNSHPTTQHVT